MRMFGFVVLSEFITMNYLYFTVFTICKAVFMINVE